VNDVRLLAAALGIQYREVPDHTFNHSTLISLADRNGVIRDRTPDLSDEKGDFLTAIRGQLAPAVHTVRPQSALIKCDPAPKRAPS
jgi:protein SCO1